MLCDTLHGITPQNIVFFIVAAKDVIPNIIAYTVVAKYLASCEHRVNNLDGKVLCMHKCMFQKTSALAFPPHFSYMRSASIHSSQCFVHGCCTTKPL